MLGDRRRRRHPRRTRHRGPDAAREPARRFAVSALGQRSGVRGTAILRWLQAAQIETAYIDPNKPCQNGTDESFNGKLRDQYLSLQWFRNRTGATVSIEAWREHYNEVRPHSSLGYLTPAEFKAKHLAGSIDGGRAPAMPARPAITKNDEPLTGPVGAVLQ
jgi:hypothetical protein